MRLNGKVKSKEFYNDRTDFDPSSYPIIVRLVEYPDAELKRKVKRFMVSQPDLELMKTEISLTELNDPRQIGQMVLDMLEQSMKRYNEYKSIGAPVKGPSLSDMALKYSRSQMFKIKETAKILQISQDTLRRICDDKQIGFTLSKGRHRRFSREDIERYLSTKK